MFQDMQAEYEDAFNRLKNQQNYEASKPNSEVKPTTEAPEEFMNIINELIKMDGLTIELCGCWIWIGGETRIHKERLKALGGRLMLLPWQAYHERNTRDVWKRSLYEFKKPYVDGLKMTMSALAMRVRYV